MSGADACAVAEQLLQRHVDGLDVLDVGAEEHAAESAIADCLVSVMSDKRETDERRSAALWLLRKFDRAVADVLVGRLREIVVSDDEPSPLRVLAVDGIDTLLVNGHIQCSDVDETWRSLRDCGDEHVIRRWTRMAVNSQCRCLVADMREALRKPEWRLMVLEELASSDAEVAHEVVTEWLASAPPGEREDLGGVWKEQMRRSAKRMAIESSDCMRDEMAVHLLHAGEFAVLHKLAQEKRLSNDMMRGIRETDGASMKLSKSQRKFLRKITEMQRV